MFKRIFIALFILNLSLNAVEVTVEKDIQELPEDLKKQVVSYWKKRAKKDFEETYAYELPYLQYLHTPLWYEKFFQDAPKFSKIIVKKVEKINKNKSIIGLLLYPKYSPKSFVFLYDTWVKVDGQWYHKYSDRALPGN